MRNLIPALVLRLLCSLRLRRAKRRMVLRCCRVSQAHVRGNAGAFSGRPARARQRAGGWLHARIAGKRTAVEQAAVCSIRCGGKQILRRVRPRRPLACKYLRPGPRRIVMMMNKVQHLRWCLVEVIVDQIRLRSRARHFYRGSRSVSQTWSQSTCLRIAPAQCPGQTAENARHSCPIYRKVFVANLDIVQRKRRGMPAVVGMVDFLRHHAVQRGTNRRDDLAGHDHQRSRLRPPRPAGLRHGGSEGASDAGTTLG